MLKIGVSSSRSGGLPDDTEMSALMIDRHRVSTSLVGVASLFGLLVLIAWLMPLGTNADHAGGHIALGVSLLVLLFLAVKTWPAIGAGRAPRIVRGALLLGIALFAVGQMLEAVGAFGYEEDGLGRANDLALAHDLGVAVGPAGFTLTLAGTIMSIGVALAARRGNAGSRHLTAAVIVAITAVAIFEVGALVFGY